MVQVLNFFYPATFVQGNVNCEVKTISEVVFLVNWKPLRDKVKFLRKNDQMQNSMLAISMCGRAIDIWCILKEIFQVLSLIWVFVDGWNIATVNGSEILHVRGLFEDHEPLLIETESLTSRYVVSASGSRSETDNAFALDHEGQYTISLAPLTWIFGDTTANSVNSTIFGTE